MIFAYSSPDFRSLQLPNQDYNRSMRQALNLEMALSARSAVGLALFNDTLKRPFFCSECGVIEKLVAHHDDYAWPLTVRWLCKRCHHEWHYGPGTYRTPRVVRPKIFRQWMDRTIRSCLGSIS